MKVCVKFYWVCCWMSEKTITTREMRCHVSFFTISIETAKNTCSLLLKTHEMPVRVFPLITWPKSEISVASKHGRKKANFSNFWLSEADKGDLKHLCGKSSDMDCWYGSKEFFWPSFCAVEIRNRRNKPRTECNFFCAINIQFLLWVAL